MCKCDVCACVCDHMTHVLDVSHMHTCITHVHTYTHTHMHTYTVQRCSQGGGWRKDRSVHLISKAQGTHLADGPEREGEGGGHTPSRYEVIPHAHIHILTSTFTHIYAHVNTHAHINIYVTHTYTHTYTHTHIYAHVTPTVEHGVQCDIGS